MAAGTLVCSRCKIPKPISAFYKRNNRKRGYESECKKCKCIRLKPYSKCYDQKKNLWKKYRLTLEDWESLFEDQMGRCAICGRHQSEIGRTLCTDHNHITGEVRGLLCSKCNDGLGRFCADTGTNLLKNAIHYLEDE